jgi:hypothetical protein
MVKSDLKNSKILTIIFAQRSLWRLWSSLGVCFYIKCEFSIDFLNGSLFHLVIETVLQKNSCCSPSSIVSLYLLDVNPVEFDGINFSPLLK